MLRQGRRCSCRGLQLLILPRSETKPSRAGFVVRRKLGGAVARNLMKRRMREAFRQVKHRIKGGNDLVLSSTETMDYREVNRRLEELLAKAGVLKG